MNVSAWVLMLLGCRFAEFSDGQNLRAPIDVPSEPEQADPKKTDPTASCDTESPVVLFVSPDDSNSMSAPVQVRAAAHDGFSDPRGVAHRTWEFFNYYTWDYAPAPGPGELALDVQLAERGEPGSFALQVGLTSHRLRNRDRDPMNLTFVMDASGSMSGLPIELSQQVLRDISSQLREGDVVSMVTWDTRNAVVLNGHAVSGPDDNRLDREIRRLVAGGGTDLANGLQEGYRLARENARKDRINRVVLVSDGRANTGITDQELIGAAAGGEDEAGLYLIGVGVEEGRGYNDLLMDRVTDLGRGASVFIPDADESARMFRGRFLETLSVAARDVSIRYDLPPGFEIVAFSGEEISENPEEVRPQHVAPSDSVVLHQHVETCAEVDDKDEISVTATYRDPVTFEERTASGTWSIGQLLAGDTAQLDKGAAIFAYAQAMDTHLDEGPTVAEALQAVSDAEGTNPGDADLAEIKSVLLAVEE